METMCYNEIETEKDKEEFQWYMKSAEGGNLLGQNNLGYCYDNGIGTTKDEKKAFQWYLKSAEGGDHTGQVNLGYCYDNGIGTTKDEEKAFLWYLKSAEGGNHMGQNDLGDCYYYGTGTIKDKEKAFHWYLKSAEGGNSSGQNELGYCYCNGIGTTKDEEKAFYWFLKSAEGGNSDGQDNIGYCYCNGIGTTKDKEKAFLWYLKSAEGGNHMGQNNLGDCYYYGIGTIKDEEKAFQWYLKSAEGGNSTGQCNLGYCYENGIGTTKDEEKVFQWYLKSAERENSTAQFNIGYCYENGIGTIKDEEKACKWYLKSAEENQISIEYCHRNEIGISKVKNNQNKLKHRCHNCENLNIKNYICSNCKLIEMLKWTSGNNEIDKIIQMTQSDNNAKEWEIWRWINYSKFKNIEYLAEGGFGSIWKAEWVDMPEELFEFYKSNQVAFKKLKDSQKISSEFLRDRYVLPILGITQDPMTKEYTIVLRYMKNGNLRDYLKQNNSLPWIERLLMNSFIRGLKVIHSKGLIHRDLHPGNLMVTEAFNNSKFKFIRLGDLGLCRFANENSSSGAYGILPYIAPEVLDKYQCTQASDIYSVGIIMWIISTGIIPFAKRAYDSELAADIFNGLRPKINRGTPQCWVELMKKCWHKDPAKRPNAEMIFYTLEKWIEELMFNEETEHSFMFLNANEKMMQDEDFELSSAETTHSKAYLISHLLPSLSHIQPSSILKFDINKMNFNNN
ncbi:hypothetical protein Glove_14g11 [Diversispora epigaea]|uniref:Protein kinase domain-containing protein n=1 Tax=Diversispora epigaea TaxID=1348612 RepID=A0A397JQ07_9GLOM|nr:hypothetical protein Glove_14g11 [Diversispora epigaea]